MWGQYYFETNSLYLCLSWRNDERKYIISYSSNVVLKRFGQVVLPYVLTFIILRTKAVHRCTLRRLRGPIRPKNPINNLQKAQTHFLRATQCFLLSGMREDFRMDTSLVLRSTLILAVMYSIVVPSCLKP